MTGNPAPTTADVTGLTNGTTYTFTVTASNPAGTGPASAQSNAVTPSASVVARQNGGFESGLTAWTTGGVVTAERQHEPGPLRQRLGPARHRPAGTEPAGDSTLSQTVADPLAGHDHAELLVLAGHDGRALLGQRLRVRLAGGPDPQHRPAQTLASVLQEQLQLRRRGPRSPSTCTPYAGQNVVLWFNVHQDGSNPPDDTWMYLDDVTLTAADGAGGADRGDGDGGQRVGDRELDGAAGNGGSAITSYTVTPFIGSTAQTPVTVTGSPPATSTTVTGLTNGTTYTSRVGDQRDRHRAGLGAVQRGDARARRRRRGRRRG